VCQLLLWDIVIKQRWNFAGLHHTLRATRGGSRIVRDHLAGDQPVEQHPHRGELLLHAGRGMGLTAEPLYRWRYQRAGSRPASVSGPRTRQKTGLRRAKPSLTAASAAVPPL
jgi:hypothetical protein